MSMPAKERAFDQDAAVRFHIKHYVPLDARQSKDLFIRQIALQQMQRLALYERFLTLGRNLFFPELDAVEHHIVRRQPIVRGNIQRTGQRAYRYGLNSFRLRVLLRRRLGQGPAALADSPSNTTAHSAREFQEASSPANCLAMERKTSHS
jgi:hypothetical protein